MQTHSANRRSYGVCGEVDAVEKGNKGQCIYVSFPKETTNLMKSLGAGELVVGKVKSNIKAKKIRVRKPQSSISLTSSRSRRQKMEKRASCHLLMTLVAWEILLDVGFWWVSCVAVKLKDNK